MFQVRKKYNVKCFKANYELFCFLSNSTFLLFDLNIAICLEMVNFERNEKCRLIIFLTIAVFFPAATVKNIFI